MQKVPNELSSHLFWDVEVSALDMETHAGYIIPRVMDYGDWDAVRFVFRYYPEPILRNALIKAPALQMLTINFFHIYYGIPLEAFKAYQKLKHAHWKR